MTPTERAQVWQQHITDWQATGVSGSSYCKQQSLVYHQFVYWRRKLAPTEDSLANEQAATGFTRVVSAPGVGIGGADGLAAYGHWQPGLVITRPCRAAYWLYMTLELKLR